MRSGLAVWGGKVRKAAEQTWEESLGAPQSSQTECLRSFLSHGRYRPGLSHGTLPSAISSLNAGMTLRSSLPCPSDALPTPNIIPCTGCTLYFSFKYLLDTDRHCIRLWRFGLECLLNWLADKRKPWTCKAIIQMDRGDVFFCALVAIFN